MEPPDRSLASPRPTNGKFVRHGGWIAVALVLGVLAGAGGGGLLGFMLGQARADRRLYNLAVRDAKDIHEAVQRSGDVVERMHVAMARVRARASDPTSPSIDLGTLAPLAQMESPFTAADFSRRRILALRPEVVDAIFLFASDIAALWEQVAHAEENGRALAGVHDPQFAAWVLLVRDAADRAAHLVERQRRLLADLEEVARLEEVSTL